MKARLALAIVFWLSLRAKAFCTSGLSRRSVITSALRSANVQPTLDDLRSRSVKQLKEELQALQVSTKGAIEKEDLVQRLFEAQNKPKSSSTPSPDKPAASVPLTTPLLLSSLEQDTPVQAQRFGQDYNFRPSAQPYCAIRVKVQGKSLFPIRNDDSSVLTLLVDTACSGVLLKPDVVERLGLPVVTSPVTMTSGGGTASANSQVTTLDYVSIMASNTTATATTMGIDATPASAVGRNLGPLPAVIQDIGALPNSLDGILGLSVLSQFDTLELDFTQSSLSLWEQPPPPPPSSLSYKKVATAPLHRLGALGIYAVDTWWGGRGPVRMLVDTGVCNLTSSVQFVCFITPFHPSILSSFFNFHWLVCTGGFHVLELDGCGGGLEYSTRISYYSKTAK
jgi:hypothetical protein